MGWLDPVSDLLRRIPQQVGTFAGKAVDLGGKVAGAIPGLAQGGAQAQGPLPLAEPERALPQLSQKKSVAMGEKVLGAFSGIGKILYGEDAWKGMSKGEKALTATLALGQGFRTFANAHWGDPHRGALTGPSALESLRFQTSQWAEEDDPRRQRKALAEQILADPKSSEWDRTYANAILAGVPMKPEDPAERRADYEKMRKSILEDQRSWSERQKKEYRDWMDERLRTQDERYYEHARAAEAREQARYDERRKDVVVDQGEETKTEKGIVYVRKYRKFGDGRIEYEDPEGDWVPAYKPPSDEPTAAMKKRDQRILDARTEFLTRTTERDAKNYERNNPTAWALLSERVSGESDEEFNAFRDERDRHSGRIKEPAKPKGKSRGIFSGIFGGEEEGGSLPELTDEAYKQELKAWREANPGREPEREDLEKFFSGRYRGY